MSIGGIQNKNTMARMYVDGW